MWVQSCKPHNIWETLGLNAPVRMPEEEEKRENMYFGTYYVHSRYPKEIVKMERHFSALQRWLQK